MCDIAVCIAKAQDDAEMDWHVYEIKLVTVIYLLYYRIMFVKTHTLWTKLLVNQYHYEKQ